jgi:hypothetical protein
MIGAAISGSRPSAPGFRRRHLMVATVPWQTSEPEPQGVIAEEEKAS